MSPRRDPNKPAMKYRGFYCDDELYTAMQSIAARSDVNESDSEYIRKAVQMRNEQYKQTKMIYKGQVFEKYIPTEEDKAKTAKMEAKEQSKPTMVQSFAKGEKK